MTILSAVITSDWHLDKFHSSRLFRRYFSERQDITMQMSEIEKPFKYAIRQGVEHVFVLGDIGEHHVLTAEATAALLRLLLKYDGVLNIYLILGNHDVSDIRTNSLSTIKILVENERFKSVYFFDTSEQIILDEVRVNFLPFPEVRPIDNRNAVNLAHVEAIGSIRDNGREISEGVDFTKNPRSYWVSGHLHTYQELKRGVFCGSPYQCTFGETLPCGFVHLKAKTSDRLLKVKHRFINSKPGFRLVNFNVETRLDWQNLKVNPKLFYKVTVADGITVPDNIRVKVPNIVDLKGEISHSEQIVVEDQEVPVASLDSGLKDFLSKSLDDAQVERAMEYVKEANVSC